jgi:hypothetical protein
MKKLLVVCLLVALVSSVALAQNGNGSGQDNSPQNGVTNSGSDNGQGNGGVNNGQHNGGDPGNGGGGGNGGNGGQGGNGGSSQSNSSSSAVSGSSSSSSSNSVAVSGSSSTSGSSATGGSANATGGNATGGSSTSTVSNSGNSSATGGQGGTSSSVAKGGSVSNSGNSSSNSGGNTLSSTYNQVHQAPAVFAPNSYPTAPCRVAASGGASWLTGGVSIGGSKMDNECDKRETARSFALLGQRDAACKILLRTKAAKDAGLTPTDCVPPIQAAVIEAPKPEPVQVTVQAPVIPAPQVTVLPAPVVVQQAAPVPAATKPIFAVKRVKKPQAVCKQWDVAASAK